MLYFSFIAYKSPHTSIIVELNKSNKIERFVTFMHSLINGNQIEEGTSTLFIENKNIILLNIQLLIEQCKNESIIIKVVSI